MVSNDFESFHNGSNILGCINSGDSGLVVLRMGLISVVMGDFCIIVLEGGVIMVLEECSCDEWSCKEG